MMVMLVMLIVVVTVVVVVVVVLIEIWNLPGLRDWVPGKNLPAEALHAVIAVPSNLDIIIRIEDLRGLRIAISLILRERKNPPHGRPRQRKLLLGHSLRMAWEHNWKKVGT